MSLNKTGAQLGALIRLGNQVSDAVTTGSVPTYTVAAGTNLVTFNSVSPVIHGISVPGEIGQFLIIQHIGSGSTSFVHESSTAGAAGERLRLGAYGSNTTALVIGQNQNAVFTYDNRWIWLGSASSAFDGDKGDITVTSGGRVWTIDANIAKTWTGVHSFTGASHTIDVTGAANISADAASLITTSVGDISLTTTAAAGTSRIEARGGSGVSGGAEIRVAGSVVAEATNFFRVSTGDPFVERLEIEPDGAWQINGNTGNAGAAMLSNGNSASPEWGLIARNTAVTTITNSTAVLTWQTLTIPANTLADGDTYELFGGARYLRGATATASNFTFQFRINASNVVETTRATSTINGGAGEVSMRVILWCDIPGASGSLTMVTQIIDNVTSTVFVTTPMGSFSVNTTADITVDMRSFFSVAVSSLSQTLGAGIFRRIG